MKIIVSKFGGSSTANAENLERIHRLVRASPERRCVVLSAPGVDDAHSVKVTTMLESCWGLRKNPFLLERAIGSLARRFREISDALGLSDMTDLIFREIAGAVSISLPHTLSRGEYLCATLFARYTGFSMVDASILIAFDGEGRLDRERTRQNMQHLDCSAPVVIPGFYGADPDGNIHTFPRNGSDISGALAAADLGAGLFENWTDVPGLMTADPAVVPEARLIPHIGYRQMRALSRAGAQVLHPACLDPVAMAGIPTRLRSTLQPECFGTLIDERCDRNVPCVVGQRDAELPDGRAAARISVFGVPTAAVRTAARTLEPIDAIGHQERTDVYVPPCSYTRALRSLHGALVLRNKILETD